MSRYIYKANEVCYSANVNETCANLLTDNFLKWQKDQGQVRKLKDFADYLDIHEVTLNQLINGRKKATSKMLIHLAQKTGDIRFYDIENLPHPDPDLQTLNRLWPFLTEDSRHTILKQAEKYATDNEQPSTQSKPATRSETATKPT